MKGGVYIFCILCILCILCIFCIFCIFCALISCFMSGYDLSDDEEQDIPPSQTQDLEPHDPDHPSDILHPPAPLMALPPQPQATFDFHSLSFMRKSDGKLASLLLRNWTHYCGSSTATRVHDYCAQPTRRRWCQVGISCIFCMFCLYHIIS